MPGFRVVLAALALLPAFSDAVFAQAPATPQQLTLSGYVQPQYETVTQDGNTTDRVFFRRIMLTLDAPVAPQWTGRVQVDVAPVVTGDRLVLKDAYIRYNGLAGHGLAFTLGNQKTPYSRSVLAPSSRRSLAERPFTGDRNFGSPGRAIALRVDGAARADHVQWIAAVGSALHSPDPTRLRLEGLADASDDWNQGVLASGRVELHPFGATPRDQGAFGGPKRLVIGAGAYVWTNDGDVNDYTEDGRATSKSHVDVETVKALELSAGWRGNGLSVDAEYHWVTANANDPSFSGGLYAAGDAALHESGIEAGVMLVPRRFEVLASFDTLAVQAWDTTTWRPSVGASYYIAAHTLKISFMHRETYNDGGISGRRLHATYVVAQFAF